MLMLLFDRDPNIFAFIRIPRKNEHSWLRLIISRSTRAKMVKGFQGISILLLILHHISNHQITTKNYHNRICAKCVTVRSA